MRWRLLIVGACARLPTLVGAFVAAHQREICIVKRTAAASVFLARARQCGGGGSDDDQ